jgi:hypothetical protein
VVVSPWIADSRLGLRGCMENRAQGQANELFLLGSGCTVELTEVAMHGERWWTLGFEATGPIFGLQSLIEGTAALVFEPTAADGLELSSEDSGSYASWLRDRIRSDTG